MSLSFSQPGHSLFQFPSTQCASSTACCGGLVIFNLVFVCPMFMNVIGAAVFTKRKLNSTRTGHPIMLYVEQKPYLDETVVQCFFPNSPHFHSHSFRTYWSCSFSFVSFFPPLRLFFKDFIEICLSVMVKCSGGEG